MFVYIYLKIYKDTRRSASKKYYTNVTDTTILMTPLKICFSFIIFYFLILWLGNSPVLKISTLGSLTEGPWTQHWQRRARENRAREAESWVTIFLPGRFLKTPKSRASVVWNKPPGVTEVACGFYFWPDNETFSPPSVFCLFTVIYLPNTLICFDVAVEFHDLTRSFLVPLCRVSF